MVPRSLSVAVSVLLLAASGCGIGGQPSPAESPPLPARASEPDIVVADDGTVWLSWVEEQPAPARLRLARFDERGWGAVESVVEDRSLLLNWADFPVLAVGAAGRLSAAWPMRRTDHPWAYDVVVASRADDAWTTPRRVHDDASAVEHGFATAVVAPDGALDLLWLDGRATTRAGGPTQLLHRRLDSDGAGAETALDKDACSCCRAAAVEAQGVLVVAYRDHAPGEIRDVAVVRRVDGSWQAPSIPHADGWRIAGCPVNGPALAAAGREVALAWFTAADGEPRVLLSHSSDAGATFDEPRRIDDGDPIGRVDVGLLDDGTTVVTWLERTASGAEVRLRIAATDAPSAIVGATSSARESGFPRLALRGRTALVAWTEALPHPVVRLDEVGL